MPPTATYPALQPNSLSSATIEALRFDAISRPLADVLRDPATVEQALSPEMVTTFSEASYLLAWRTRKAMTAEGDTRAVRAFAALPEPEVDFIRNLSNGKLAYYLSFVSREGIEAMIQIGEQERSLYDLKDCSGLTGKESPEFVRDTLARLHHENWLNQNALIERVNRWNHEWGTYPPELEHGYELDRVQADMDCRALAGLPDVLRERLIEASVPGENGAFFHPDRVIAVRSTMPVQYDREGEQFDTHRDGTGLIELVTFISQSPGTNRYYEIHSILNRLEVSARDRGVLSGLLYAAGGKTSEAISQNVSSMLHGLTSEGFPINTVDATTLLTEVRRRLVLSEAPTTAELRPQRTESWNPRIEHPEALTAIASLTRGEAKRLLELDLQELSPVFRRIDALDETVQGTTFIQIVSNLRDICERRKQVVRTLASGLLSRRDPDLVCSLGARYPEHPISIEEMCAVFLPQPAAMALKQQYTGYTTSRKTLLHKHGGMPMPAHLHCSELLTLQMLPEAFPSLRAVIEQHLIEKKKRDVSKQGGDSSRRLRPSLLYRILESRQFNSCSKETG